MDGFVSPREAKDGTTNEPLETDLATNMAIAAFTGIAWCNVVELNISIYMTFKRKRGLYFWSLFLSILGIAMHSLAFILKFYAIIELYEVTISMVTVGWYLMVTGQSLVLYSRLHLVINEIWIIRSVLFMIIWNAVTLHIPTTVLTYGANSPDHTDFYDGYIIMEKIQMTIFCAQELLISFIYIWATVRFLRPFYQRQIRSVMAQLLWINVGIIIMDLAMLIVEYLDYYSLEVAMKSAIYSVKLKIEFAVLNQLMRIAKSSRDARLAGRNPNDLSDPGSHQRSGRGFKGFIRRIFPQPEDFQPDFRPGSVFIGGAGASATASKKNNAAQLNGNMSVVSAHRPGDDVYHDGNVQGISVTREITQVSNLVDRNTQVRHRGKPTEYYPGSGNSRDASLEIVGDGVDSDHSQMELVDLPSSASGHSSKVIESGEVVETTVPKRTAQPAWKSRPNVTGVQFRNGVPDYD